MTIEEAIISVEVPEKTKSYTPTSHGSIIKRIEDLCEDKRLEIVDRSYQANNDYNKITGKYTLNLKDDDIGCMIAFQNSYDKSLSAKFAIGASVFICSNGMVLGDHTIKRKHTGESNIELNDFIKTAIDHSIDDFDKTVLFRDSLKDITISENVLNELIGEMFIQDNILRTEQLTFMRKEYNKPTYDYKVDKNNLWNIYNLLTDSIERKSHPSLYFTQHRDVTKHIKNKFFAETIEAVELTVSEELI